VIDVLVVTESRRVIPELLSENEGIMTSLGKAGLEARLVDWHDPQVDWRQGRMVLVRTTWDYPEHVGAFLAWADHLESLSVDACNPPAVLRWNHDKGYLIELQDLGLPTVPATLVAAGETVKATERPLVLKPAVGVGSIGAQVIEVGHSIETAARSVVNPYFPEISRGELSVFMIGSTPVLGVRKTPSHDDWRVQTQWGGRFHVEEEIDEAAIELSVRALAAAMKCCKQEDPLLYLRVDLIQSDQGWLVLELEAIEPSLYCSATQIGSDALASTVANRLGSGQ
jgi:glutathione synthase/RimK-type ligase-like ATP-grasp enzyme